MRKKVLLLAGLLAVIAGGSVAFLLVPPKPEYCWLVFGPETKLRVLVRLQGSSVSICPGGDPSASGAWFGRMDECQDVVLSDPDDQATYTITRMSRIIDEGGPLRRRSIMINVHIQGSLDYRQYCDLEVCPSPLAAKEAHFHGPLTVEVRKVNWELRPDLLALRRGSEPTRIPVIIGTMDAKKGCWVVVRNQYKPPAARDELQPAFAKGVHPFVDVEFPAAQEGAAPIKRRYPLDNPC